MKKVGVGDIVHVADQAGCNRFYRVLGVYLGAASAESMVELEVLDRAPGKVGRTGNPPMYVPLCFIAAGTVYRAVE